MTDEKDERKRGHLRLVVNNIDKRNPPRKITDDFIPLEDLISRKDDLRQEFYDGMFPWQVKSYAALEQYLLGAGIPYGLDPHHGHVIVVPAANVAPDAMDLGVIPQDEVLLYVSEDAASSGACISLEMVLPYFSDDPADMEDALLSTPVVQFGTYFLEENPQDGLLDLIYRVTFPAFPPAVTGKLLDRLFAIGRYELTETLRAMSGDEN